MLSASSALASSQLARLLISVSSNSILVIVRRDNTHTVQSQIPLLKAIANGIQWQQYLDDGLFKSVQELAKHLGKERAVVSHTLQLAQLSPEIIHLAVIGALPEHITLKSLKTGLPADWEEQKKFLRIE